MAYLHFDFVEIWKTRDIKRRSDCYRFIASTLGLLDGGSSDLGVLLIANSCLGTRGWSLTTFHSREIFT